MKRYITILCLLSFSLQAQTVWIEATDGGAFSPEKESKIYIDLSQTANEFGIIEAAQSGEDMFIWTWKPKEHPAGHPLVNGLGSQAWKNSNDELKLTKESDLIYSYTLTPTEFYEVGVAEVYDNDICFLVKPKDGGGFGDPDIKTEDIKLVVDPPGLPKILAIPAVLDASKDTLVLPITPNEIVTVRYDFTQEKNTNLQSANDFYVYLRAIGDDGNEYKVAQALNQVTSTEELRMTFRPDNSYTLSFIPNKIFEVPNGVNIAFMRYQILRDGFRTTNDIVFNGSISEFRYSFLCN